MVEITIRKKHRDIYSAFLGDGTHLCDSKRPFFDAARVLSGMGYADDECLMMRHERDEYISLTAPIGWTRSRTVMESEKDGPRIVRWMPFPGST